MKKLAIYLMVIGLLVAMVIGVNMGIQGFQTMKREGELCKYELQILSLSQWTGMRYLGRVDTYEISKKSGAIYDGTAVYAELLRRAGFPEDSLTWGSLIKDEEKLDNAMLHKLTIFKAGQELVPIKEREIEKEFLWLEV